MPTSFENFVNTELPKRIATNESPTTPQAGDIPVFTGVGLLTESKTASGAGLATETFATDAADTAETNAKSYADSVVTSIYKFQTTYNPQTTGNFPTTANTVGGVAIKKGFTWVVSGVTGQYTFQGVTVDNGDTLLALVDDASSTSAADWHITEKNLGYTPENQANKVDDLTESTSTAKYTSVKAVVDGLSGKQNTLTDVITAGTYGSSTQWPAITFNAKGIATGVTLQTVSVAEVSDSVFRIVDNTDSTKKIAFEASGIATGETRTITMPDVDVDLGKLLPLDQAISFSNAEKLQGQLNLGLQSTGNTIATGNFALWCENTVLSGSNNTAIHCRNISVNTNQKDASFTDMWDVLSMNGSELGNGETDLLFPRGSKVVGFNRNDSSIGSADMFTCTTMFHLIKPADGTVTVADQAGILPYVAFGSASGSSFGSFLNVGHHVLEVALGGGFIQEFTILAHKNASTYTLTASEQTKRTPAASSVFLNLTTTIVNNRLNMVLELNAPYNSNSAYIIAKLTSYYNIDF